VALLNYNLPPWLCTKKFFILLALLIPGKQFVTSEHLDVYLEPLVEELLQLWEGVSTYDVYKEVGYLEFTLRGMLIWTIHDYPSYGTVGGFSHQGYAGYPYCGSDLGAEHFVNLGKQTYGGTRRWLPWNHAYRLRAMVDHFNGQVENQDRPNIVSMEDQLTHAAKYKAWKQAGHREGSVGDPSKVHGVKRTSIMFRLSYWKVHD
jgi:hypothetical protein